MSEITFSDISKTYRNGVAAVRNFSLRIPAPTLAVLVGPSGCGKTTVLRLLAGLEQPTSGEIYLAGKRIDTMEPRKRDIAMVFQSYALYPHMTVRENLSFGLSIRKVAKSEIKKRVEQIAERLEIFELLDRKPGEISGGQRQRVALGRAIIRQPKVFLFDEPLSSLDARLRMDMRYMIKKLYNDLRTTTVYVTHDQVEAMTIGEMLIVMEKGNIHQIGTPEECYRCPVDTFVASFLGSPPMNLIKASFQAGSGELLFKGGAVSVLPRLQAERLRDLGHESLIIGVRPEHLCPEEPGHEERMRLEGSLVLTEPLGHEKLVHVDLGGEEVIAKSPSDFPDAGGGTVKLCVEPAKVLCFSTENGKNLLLENT
jgi:ABC-type sugar transport system ATPase subunit